MSKYPEALGQRPLEVREAYEALEAYVTAYGHDPLLLMMHAAVPETLRADLLNLIKLNFLSGHVADMSIEADVLFSPLVTDLGGGYYRIDSQVRWHCLGLLRSLYRNETRSRQRRVAELLWRYVETMEHKAARTANPLLIEFLDIQRWVAFAFLDPNKTANAFAQALKTSEEGQVTAALLRFGGLASAIEIPLAHEQELLAYAQGLNALASGDEDRGREILEGLGGDELRIGDVVLRSPLKKISEKLKNTEKNESGTHIQCDVFISYAHADDKPAFGEYFGWVSSFVAELQKQLRSKLGGNGAIIWMDHKLAANDQVSETSLEMVSNSQTIVIFMSESYSQSKWCQKELGTFLDHNKAHKNKESIFIVELAPTNRENWHPRLLELMPIRFWREGRDHVPQLLGMPVPNPNEHLYWQNLSKLSHLIANYLEAYPQNQISEKEKPVIDHIYTKAKPIVWIAEPTDDLIDQWEALTEVIRQAGYDIRPLGLDYYPRTSETDFLSGLRPDLENSQLFVQLLGQAAGRKPKDSNLSFAALQSAAASELAKQRQIPFLQWRSRELKLENVADMNYRQLLTGTIACGFEEFRQRVLDTIQNLDRLSATKKPLNIEERSLTICIIAHKLDQDLGYRVRDILVDLGVDVMVASTEPAPDQSSADFNAQLNEIISASEGIIIVYGQSSPAWVQAQFIRARKVLAPQRKGIWVALLDGPPREKQDVGIKSPNLMSLDCRDGLERSHIEQFVNTLREAGHA